MMRLGRRVEFQMSVCPCKRYFSRNRDIVMKLGKCVLWHPREVCVVLYGRLSTLRRSLIFQELLYQFLPNLEKNIILPFLGYNIKMGEHITNFNFISFFQFTQYT